MRARSGVPAQLTNEAYVEALARIVYYWGYAAALRSLDELKDAVRTGMAGLYFGPTAPAGQVKQWVKTIPGKGWFAYFRIYGPEPPTFDGKWKPGDFEEIR